MKYPRFSQLPFGEALEGADASNRYRFSGKEMLDQAALVDFGARWLAPEEGRFTEPDPVQGSLLSPQALNRYIYLNNNPLGHRGVSGMDDEMDLEQLLAQHGEGYSAPEGDPHSGEEGNANPLVQAIENSNEAKAGQGMTFDSFYQVGRN